MNRTGLGIGKLVGVAVLAFGFSFALVPLYRIACEKVFGIRLERGPAEGEARAAAPASRTVTVLFDGAVNSKLPWEFEPRQVSMQVRVGEPYEAVYYARNVSDRAIVGNAVPSVAPARASAHFSKTECFCFTAQTLQPGEGREMPVRFIVARDLPADVHTVTLSYTFFKNEAQTAQLAAPAERAATGAPHAAP